MKLRYRYANQAVGLFVVIAVALTIALVVFMGANQRWFRRNYDYHARFTTAKDVSVGMAVTFRGFTIGRVTLITLTEENEVDVTFSVQEEYIDKVTRDSLIQVVTSPLGGGQILFHQGREPTPPLPENTYIPTFDSKQGLRLREENRVIILRDADPIAQIIGQVDPILLNADRLLANLASLSDEIRLTLRGEAGGPVARTLEGVEGSVQELQQTVVRVNALIDDTAGQIERLVVQVESMLEGLGGVYARIDGVFEEVDGVFAGIDGVFGNIDDLFGDVAGITHNIEATTASFVDPTGLVTRLLDPKGSIATFLDDDNQLYDQVSETVASLDRSIIDLQLSLDEISEFATYLNAARPQISTLLEVGRQTLASGQEVLEGVRNNPLLRGGIPERRDQPTTFQGSRDEEF